MRRPQNDDWISASEIGEFVFCARAHHLKRAGTQPVANEVARESGSAHHRAIGKRVRRVEPARRLAVGLLLVALGLVALLVVYWLRSR